MDIPNISSVLSFSSQIRKKVEADLPAPAAFFLPEQGETWHSMY
jgi:hypothetical protein